MPNSAKKEPNRYSKIIERIFLKYYKEGAREVIFEREDIEKVAKELKIKLPKNLGDVIYSFNIEPLFLKPSKIAHQKVKIGLFVLLVALAIVLLQLN